MEEEHSLEKSDNFLEQVKVLCVDESLECLEKSEKKLEESREYIEVIKETDMNKALDIAKKEDVDLILSSLQVENGDGLELLEKIKNRHSDLPFILLTSEEKNKIKTKAFSKGADDYLRKDPNGNYSKLARRVENIILESKLQEDEKMNRKELNQYRKLVETASEAMVVVNSDLKVVKANQAIEDIANIQPEEIEGNNIKIFKEKGIVQEEEFERIQQYAVEFIEDEESESSIEEVELKVGGDKKYVELNLTKFYDGKGELAGLTCIGHDITDIEKKKRSSQQRLDEFSSLVSHDLRNPLNLAQGYLDLARETEDKEDYHVIEKAHNRMERIIDELLIITSQDDEIEKKYFSLRNTFEEAFYFAGEQSYSYTVEEDTEIYGDRTSAISLFENLISNSIDHNEEPVEMRIGPTENGFYYEDTGQGIDEDKREHVFEYGYSSSEEGRGIGLAIVKRIAEANDWEFELGESEEGGIRLEFETSKGEQHVAFK